jgi:hypothetical protein
LEPRVFGAVSAGAAFACAAVGGVTRTVVAEFIRQTTNNRRNFYVTHLVRRQPAFPHERIYRDTILRTIDASVLHRLETGPDVRVLLGHPPQALSVLPGVAVGLVAYEIERIFRGALHPSWPRRLGFRPTVVHASACRTPEALADLILQSSCIPPLTSVQKRNGTVVVDGAVIDCAPADLLTDEQSVLVLLSRQYAHVPRRPGRVYVQPSRPVPIAMWDYASPARVHEAFDLGRRDGEAFADSAETSALRPGTIA